jgi:hypothetical protein
VEILSVGFFFLGLRLGGTLGGPVGIFGRWGPTGFWRRCLVSGKVTQNVHHASIE